MRTRAILPATVLFLGCGWRHRVVAPEPARQPALDSLYLVDRSRSDSIVERGIIDGRLALLDSSVIFLRGGAPLIRGRTAARALLRAVRTESTGISWQPLGGGVAGDLLAAYTFGITVRVGAPDGRVHLDRYVAVWARADGQPWRIVAYAEIDPSGADDGRGRPPSGPPDETARPANVARVRKAYARAKRKATAIATLRATDSLFSDLADRMGAAYAFSHYVDDYGATFGSSVLIVGPRAVQQSLEAVSATSSLSWRPAYASVAGSLDLGFTIGSYVATSRGPSGAAIQRFGKYLTVWRRERDGTWKFMITGGNGTPARAE